VIFVYFAQAGTYKNVHTKGRIHPIHMLVRELSCLCVGWHQASATTAKIVAFQLRERERRESRALVTPKTQSRGPQSILSLSLGLNTKSMHSIEKNRVIEIGGSICPMAAAATIVERCEIVRLQNSRGVNWGAENLEVYF
jgi:hypothetical protein